MSMQAGTPDKQKITEKIDGVVAAIVASGLG